MPISFLCGRSLLKCFLQDLYSKDDLVGCVHVRLTDLEPGIEVDDWYDVINPHMSSDKLRDARLHLKVSYLPTADGVLIQSGMNGKFRIQRARLHLEISFLPTTSGLLVQSGVTCLLFIQRAILPLVIFISSNSCWRVFTALSDLQVLGFDARFFILRSCTGLLPTASCVHVQPGMSSSAQDVLCPQERNLLRSEK